MPRQIRERRNSRRNAVHRDRAIRRAREVGKPRNLRWLRFTANSRVILSLFAPEAREQIREGGRRGGKGDYEQVRSQSGAGRREGNGGDPPALRVQREVLPIVVVVVILVVLVAVAVVALP